MAHDVFISYSSVDKTAADTVCSILEQNGISCWIAPRDITPGLDFAEAIIDGIKSSKLFILIYSSNSNNSKQVIREVDRAVHLGLPVINLRLEDIPLSKQLEYYLSSVHWLDAKTPPLEDHINKLSGVVKILLRKDGAREEDLEKAIRDGILQVGQDKKSIAVLPFKNISNDPEQEYFSDGMMEEILDRLFKIGDLKVISRTSSMHYKNSDKSIKEIARELRVANIIEGSVRRAGNMVRIAVQLIDAGTDAHLWSEIYNGDLSDLSRIFVIQSEVAQSVARELKAVLSPQELDLIEKKPTKNTEAYDAYLRGMFYWRKLTRNELETAMKYFELAIEKDPEYAPAYAGIAFVYGALIQMGLISPEEGGPKTMEALMKATELDSNNEEVIYAQAGITTWMMWDWEAGESAFKKALEINPNHAEAHAYYSHLLNILGRTEEAMAEIQIALKLDPYNPLIISLYSVDLWLVRRFDEALEAAREAIRMEPLSPVAQTVLTDILHKNGRLEEAWESIKKEFIMMGKGQAFELDFKKLGYAESLIKATEALEVLSETTFVDPAMFSLVYLMAGNNERALDCWEKAYEIHSPSMPYLRMPAFDPIRDEPRFREIARKMGLPYK
ncbi:MAG: TIR domain-containing protein [Bacteroidales bacterium]|nr:TIR domain-containing protein [Bacteroidales bacterium]